MNTQRTPKQATIDMLERLGDDLSFQSIHYHVHVLEKILQGLQELEAGHLVSHEKIHEDLRRRVAARKSTVLLVFRTHNGDDISGHPDPSLVREGWAQWAKGIGATHIYVTQGPAELVGAAAPEGTLAGLALYEAETLPGAIELARQSPCLAHGAIHVVPIRAYR